MTTTATRRTRTVVLAGLMAFTATLGLAVSAHADTVVLNGSESSVYAGGDTRTHQLTVLPVALQMSNYPNGQYVEYSVVVRDITNVSAPGPWTHHAYNGPYFIDGRSTYTSCDVRSCEVMQNNVGVSLPITTLQGVAGHHYQVYVTFGYWTGASWVLSAAPVTTYSNIVYSQGISFTLPSAYAGT